MIRIDCYLSMGCASEPALRERIMLAIAAEGIEAELSVHRLDDDKAIALGATGSPAVFIDGRELQPLGIAGFT